ncbi:MAG TPA: divalent cation tolerance protein CutA [Candidatus Microsaccharimonas sp.]|nr:divalent cation tolerance protein CutA [Candidatus Microsaccharimonas sp.]
MKMNPIELFLTCASWQEAQRITDVLLEKKLVACVEQMEIRSKNWWEGAIEDTAEIKLSMLSVAEHYDKIEAEIAKLHSYETFVLKQISISHLNEDAIKWLQTSTS